MNVFPVFRPQSQTQNMSLKLALHTYIVTSTIKYIDLLHRPKKEVK